MSCNVCLSRNAGTTDRLSKEKCDDVHFWLTSTCHFPSQGVCENFAWHFYIGQEYYEKPYARSQFEIAVGSFVVSRLGLWRGLRYERGRVGC